jgi:hypothetical protein
MKGADYMIPYNQLTAIDVNILKYLLDNRHRKIHFHEVLEEFNSFKSIEFRITLFSTLDRKPFPYGPITNTSYIRFDYETIRSDEGISQTHRTPFISITELGIKAIEDYDFDYAERRKMRIEDRILRIVPIVISLVALFFSAYALFR